MSVKKKTKNASKKMTQNTIVFMKNHSSIILTTLKWLLGIAIVIAGIFCITELYQTFGVKNAEYGTPITNITEANQEELIKYELDYIDFTQDGDTYSATYTLEPLADFDGEKNDYVIYFNGVELTDTQTAGTLKSTLIKTFYDTDNIEVAKVNISIELKCTVSATVIKLSTSDSGEDIAYFGTHMTLYGATLTIAKEK